MTTRPRAGRVQTAALPPTPGSLLRRTLAGHRWRIVAGAVFASSHQAAEAAVPVAVGIVIDRAVATSDGEALAWGIAGLALVFVVLSGSFFTAVRVFVRAEFTAAHDVRMAVTRRVLDPRGGVDAALPGELLSTATSDAQRVSSVMQGTVFGAAAVAAFVVATVVLLRISVSLGVVVLLGMVLTLGVMQLLARPFERRSAAEQAGAARAAAVATDLVTGLRVLKGLGAERAGAARYRQASQASLASNLRAARFEAGADGFTIALTGVILALVALVGGRLAAQGAISVGEFVAAVGLTQFLIGPFSRLAGTVGRIAQARASAGRVVALLATPAAVTGGDATLPRPVRGELSLRGLTHAGLRSLDLEAGAGELVGVVTPDPTDAAALLACLGRRTDPEAGAVEVDRVPLPALTLDDALAAVLVATHDARLFEGTLAENVAVDGAVDRARLDAVMAAAAADEVASSLPGGTSTVLTELARSLSGGQRQRVALARALAVDPPVLVLHDPTTAVDAATEHRIAAGLRVVRAGRTTLLVTTSPALLAAADRVVLIDGGVVAAAGSHAALLRADQRYRGAVLGETEP